MPKAQVPELGATVAIRDSSERDIIAKAVVRRSGNTEIEIEDLQTHQKTEFALFEGGWKMLFRGMGGERCFSQRAPFYTIDTLAVTTQT